MKQKIRIFLISLAMLASSWGIVIHAENNEEAPQAAEEEAAENEEDVQDSESIEDKEDAPEAEEVTEISPRESIEPESGETDELIIETPEEENSDKSEKTNAAEKASATDLCVYKNTIKSFVDKNKIAQVEDYGDDEGQLVNGISNITYFDMDRNGVPELFITVNRMTYVYTYLNGSVKQLIKAETYSFMGSAYLKFLRNKVSNTFVYGCFEDGKFFYYKLNNGSFERVLSGFPGDEVWDDDIYEYYEMISVDGDYDLEISEEQLKELNQKLTDCKKNCKVFIQIFNDVRDKTKYYYDAVYWALDNDITTGVTANMFKPGANCSRAHIVTFLWRLAKKPDCSNVQLKFKDVKKGSWYEQAVKWAVKNNITTGTTATTFEPSAICTRAQIVTFLWRYKGEPNVSVTLPFKDVKKGAWYEKAVKWAYKNDVTTGVNPTTFNPYGKCTRGQAALFLQNVWQLSKQ